VTQPVDFSNAEWERSLRQFAVSEGMRQTYDFVDYFVFHKGLYDVVPPLVVGRSYWDHWLVWKGLAAGVPVVDGSKFFVAVHQNHGYGYHPGGKHGTNVDALAQRNNALSGNGREQASLLRVTHKLTRQGAVRRVMFRRVVNFPPFLHAYQFAVESTFNLRKRLGLRRQSVRKVFSREGHSNAAGT
jgi:hypothetical protein